MKLKKYNYTVDKMKLKVCAIRFNDKISFIYQNICKSMSNVPSKVWDATW